MPQRIKFPSFFLRSPQADWYVIQGDYQQLTQHFFPKSSPFAECYFDDQPASAEVIANDVIRTSAVGKRTQQRVIYTTLSNHKDRNTYLQGDFLAAASIAKHCHMDYIQREIQEAKLNDEDKENMLQRPCLSHHFCYVSRGCELAGLTYLQSKLDPNFIIITQAEKVNDKQRMRLTVVVSSAVMNFLRKQQYIEALTAEEIAYDRVDQYLASIEDDIEQSSEQVIGLRCLLRKTLAEQEHLSLARHLKDYYLNNFHDADMSNQYPLLDCKMLCRRWRLSESESQDFLDLIGDSYLFTGFVYNAIYYYQLDDDALAETIRHCLIHRHLIKDEDLAKPLMSMGCLSVINYFLDEEDEYRRIVQEAHNEHWKTADIINCLMNSLQQHNSDSSSLRVQR